MSSNKVPCECGKSYTRQNRARHLNSDYHRKRVSDNPPTEKVNCPCGSVIVYKHRFQHFSSQKHIRFEEEKKLNEMRAARIENNKNYLIEYFNEAKEKKNKTLMKEIKRVYYKNKAGEYIEDELNNIHSETLEFRRKLLRQRNHD